jgi:hypothetical protein
VSPYRSAYSSQRLVGDTIDFSGVWRLTLFNSDHVDVTGAYTDMYFFFVNDSTVKAVHNTDTVAGKWDYQPVGMRTDFSLQFPAGSLLGALNGVYHTTVISDHSFRLEWLEEGEHGQFKSMEFRKQLGI